MKKFIIQTCLFLCLLLVTNIIFYLIATKYYFNDYTILPPKRFKSFLLADSHGIILKKNTEPFGVFNFSNSGDSYHDLYRKVLFLIANNQVDTIYLTAGKHTLSTYRELSNNADRSVIYSNINEYNNPINYFIEKYLQHYFVFFAPKAQLIITEYFAGRWKRLWNKNYDFKKVNHIKPWIAMNAAERLAACQDRAQSQFGNPTPAPLLQNYLFQIMDLCKKNDITLIGIKFPLTNAYTQYIKGKDLKADSVLMANGFKVVDFSSIYLHQDSLFENQDHLNANGGKQFTQLWLHKESISK